MEVSFSICLHKRDLALLESIKAYFGDIGKIYIHSHSVHYRIESIKQIYKVVLPHFDKYPLITQKLGDYLLFKKVVEIFMAKEHLTQEGLEKIVAIKASSNLSQMTTSQESGVVSTGLSDQLKTAFSNLKLYPRPLVEGQEIKDPD